MHLHQFGTDLHRRVYAERWVTVSTLDEAMRKVETDDKYAFIWATETMKTMISERKDHMCDYTAIKERVYEGINTIAMQKGFPYRKIFDH